MTRLDDTALVLIIDTIPRSAWGQNLRGHPALWRRLKAEARKRAGGVCEICGAASDAIECHETFDWDVEHELQRLASVRAICPDCHSVIHWGRTLRVSTAREIERLRRHWQRVNGMNAEQFREHVRRAGARWLELSRYDWRLVIDGFPTE